MINAILTFASVAQQVVPLVIDIHQWTVPSYGPEITFDIKRNGKNIGTHKVSFENIDEQLHIEAVTKIRIKFLFFNAFKFDYSSREVWENGNLTTMKTYTNDNGNKSDVIIEYGSHLVNVSYGENEFTDQLDVPIFTTNHWNPNVLNADEVLNTITGKTNQVQISQVAWEAISVCKRERRAIHHKYEGELNNISAWYDENWRWVGLSFKGKDGSEISYVSNQCGNV